MITLTTEYDQGVVPQESIQLGEPSAIQEFVADLDRHWFVGARLPEADNWNGKVVELRVQRGQYRADRTYEADTASELDLIVRIIGHYLQDDSVRHKADEATHRELQSAVRPVAVPELDLRPGLDPLVRAVGLTLVGYRPEAWEYADRLAEKSATELAKILGAVVNGWPIAAVMSYC